MISLCAAEEQSRANICTELNFGTWKLAGILCILTYIILDKVVSYLIPKITLPGKIHKVGTYT